MFEASGDFVSVVPHANDPKRLQPIIKQMKSVKAVTLSGTR
jgi:hypothetical protein